MVGVDHRYPAYTCYVSVWEPITGRSEGRTFILRPADLRLSSRFSDTTVEIAPRQGTWKSVPDALNTQRCAVAHLFWSTRYMVIVQAQISLWDALFLLDLISCQHSQVQLRC